MLFVLLLMVASLTLVFLGLLTGITSRLQGASPLTHQILTYAGLLVTLLSHMIAFTYIMGLRRLLLAEPPAENEDDVSTDRC